MLFFSCHGTWTTEIYTLSLHDALPIWARGGRWVYLGTFTLPAGNGWDVRISRDSTARGRIAADAVRSEEHTSELQSRRELVCRLLLEKKNKAPFASRIGRDGWSRGSPR